MKTASVVVVVTVYITLALLNNIKDNKNTESTTHLSSILLLLAL